MKRHVAAIAACLLLAVSGPSFAAKRVSDSRSAVKLDSRCSVLRFSDPPL